MRDGSTYRAARKAEARALGLNWKTLDREMTLNNKRHVGKMPGMGNISSATPMHVVLPGMQHTKELTDALSRKAGAEKASQPVERLAGCAIQRGDKILKVNEGSHSMVRGYQDPLPGDVEGFWTTGQRFVQRPEAKAIAIAAGQLSEHWLRATRDVLSSDISWKGGLG